MIRLLILSALLICSSGMAAQRHSDSAVRLLRKPVEYINWNEMPLVDILEWLDDKGNGRVNVIPRWSQLEGEGINEESVVTLKLRETSVAEILNEVIDQLSNGNLAYYGEDNKIRISTKEDFNRKLIRRVYVVSDILFNVPDFQEEAPQIALTGQNQHGGGGSGSGQSVFGGASSGGQSQSGGGELAQELEKRLEELVALIRTSVAPHSWFDGGGQGTVNSFNRSVLVVYNTLEVHEDLAGWFVRGK